MRKQKHMPYLAVAASLLVLGCASVDGVADIDALTAKMVQTSFRDQGIAKVDRLKQDESRKPSKLPISRPSNGLRMASCSATGRRAKRSPRTAGA